MTRITILESRLTLTYCKEIDHPLHENKGTTEAAINCTHRGHFNDKTDGREFATFIILPIDTMISKLNPR